jgi:sortase A
VLENWKKQIKYLIVILILTGSALVAHSCYFYAKGALAQLLLDHAWEKAKETKKFVKAWGWADTWPVGKLNIKSIGLSKVVMNDADKRSLVFGPAHIPVTSRPGAHGNIAIAGHRDSFFRNLGLVKRGEVIELDSMRPVQYFIVTGTHITYPEDTRWIENTPEDTITLITCYPFDYVGPAPKRYVVRGKRVATPE